MSAAPKTKDNEKAGGKVLQSEDAIKKLVPNLHNQCNEKISNTEGVCTTADNRSRTSDADYAGNNSSTSPIRLGKQAMKSLAYILVQNEV